LVGFEACHASERDACTMHMAVFVGCHWAREREEYTCAWRLIGARPRRVNERLEAAEVR
jgi:hypothetical protein